VDTEVYGRLVVVGRSQDHGVQADMDDGTYSPWKVILKETGVNAPEYSPENPMDTTLSEYLQDRLESRKDDINWFLDRNDIDWGNITNATKEVIENIFINGVERTGCVDDIDQFTKVIQEWPTDPIERQLYTETIIQYLAKMAIKALSIAESRFSKLMKCISFTRCMSPRSRDFLIRVSRCYLYGFDHECIILCRAVLDADFEAEIPNDQCIGLIENRRINKNRQSLFTLSDRMSAANKLNRIDHVTYELALKVKRLGDNAVHKNLPPDVDSLMIIQSALTVIDRLYSTKASQPEVGKEIN
jgi:hypothetical protein